MQVDLPECWHHALRSNLNSPAFQELTRFVDAERRERTVFPPENEVFAAFRLTPLERVRVLILGQDPYHDVGQAHGLAFSVATSERLPPSLRNIFKELANDLGGIAPRDGNLSRWAEQGVLLLNSVLTVAAHAPASHAGRGWETFTDAVIQRVAERPVPVVFVLWGAHAQRKQAFIRPPHVVISSPHPSPLSASRGFFGSRPFSRVNTALQEAGNPPIQWSPPAI